MEMMKVSDEEDMVRCSSCGKMVKKKNYDYTMKECDDCIAEQDMAPFM